MLKVLRLVILIFPGLLLACNTAPRANEAYANVAQSHQDNGLAGSSWRLQQIQSMNDEVYLPAMGSHFTLQFVSDEQVTLQADCNRGSGSYTLNGSQMEFGVIASTRALCPPGSLHDRFLSDLQYVRSFVLTESGLHLATMADGAILTFVPVAATDSASTIAPGFACAEASGTVEELICSDSELALLDRQLNYLYQQATRAVSADELPTFRALQRGWISGRNACWQEDDVAACVESETQRRLSELQIRSGSVRVPAAVDYRCGERRLSAYFYNNTVLPMLVLNAAGQQFFLHQLPAASGSRYGIGNIEFWDSGEMARLTEFNDVIECARL